jgi:tRNA(Ile2)-agmatinylcytidine synthase
LRLHIGIDDTDSPQGGCTTHVAARIIEGLLGMGYEFTDYPNLLRLNPNVPWKTRGNGAVCLRIEVDPELEGEVRSTVIGEVEELAEFDCENTNPGMVFHSGPVPEAFIRFSDRVVGSVVTLEEALTLVNGHGASAVGYKNMRGVIGALAAVGGLQKGDHTYEILTYREPENWGKPRRLDEASVRAMDRELGDQTFNNVDPESGRVLIAPHGPDPVLYGVRGETPEAVHRAGTIVETGEPVERWAIFRSNQGTDAHLRRVDKLSDLRPYHPAVVAGGIVEAPRTIQGGHVIFGFGDDSCEIDCAAYEPTGSFREVVRRLIVGDRLEASGGVRGAETGTRRTLNLEKLEILELGRETLLKNPGCPECGGSMESMGRGKGFRCRSCGHRDGTLVKEESVLERELEAGLYVPPPKAQRHLTKPVIRYGREKTEPVLGAMYEPWHWP